MLVTQQERLRQSIRKWADEYGRGQIALLPILQQVQEKYHHVSGYAMQEIADLLGIHPVEVRGVVTFYSFLTEAPQGRFVIRLCRTISCDMAGKDRIARQLENDLGIPFGQTTPDGVFTLEWANCLGMCDQAPAMLVNDRVHTRVKPEQIHAILQDCRSQLLVSAAEKQEAHV
jgi:[NiFe] hydrogenase diaphorase moiety large subunit